MAMMIRRSTVRGDGDADQHLVAWMYEGAFNFGGRTMRGGPVPVRRGLGCVKWAAVVRE